MSRQFLVALLGLLSLTLGTGAFAGDVVNITSAHQVGGKEVYATANFALAPGRELVSVHIEVIPPTLAGQYVSIEAIKVNVNGVFRGTLEMQPGVYKVRASVRSKDSRTGALDETRSTGEIDVEVKPYGGPAGVGPSVRYSTGA